MTPEGVAGEILVPVSVKAPTSLTRTWPSTSLFQISVQALEAERRTFKLLFKMKMEHVVSFLPTQGSLLIKMEYSRACLEGTQAGEEVQTQRTNMKHSKLFVVGFFFFLMEELKSKLKRTKKGKKKNLDSGK